jgi:hypothetical protein
MRTLYLYSTAGCHLCEQALELIQPVLAQMELHVVEVDIAEHDDLLALYGVRIPVVKLAEVEHDLGWPFNADEFADYIARYPA